MKQYMTVVRSEANDYAETGRSQVETYEFEANNNDEAVVIAKKYGKDCDVLSVILISVAEEWNINLETKEQESELSLLRKENAALKADADIVKDVMGVITEFTGVDPREVESVRTQNFLCTPLAQAPLQDIAINLLNEAVRKKVEAMSCAQK